MHPITSLTDYEKNRIAGDTELFSPRNQEQAGEERPLCFIRSVKQNETKNQLKKKEKKKRTQ